MSNGLQSTQESACQRRLSRLVLLLGELHLHHARWRQFKGGATGWSARRRFQDSPPGPSAGATAEPGTPSEHMMLSVRWSPWSFPLLKRMVTAGIAADWGVFKSSVAESIPESRRPGQT